MLSLIPCFSNVKRPQLKSLFFIYNLHESSETCLTEENGVRSAYIITKLTFFVQKILLKQSSLMNI